MFFRQKNSPCIQATFNEELSHNHFTTQSFKLIKENPKKQLTLKFQYT